jgi:hypothetical protein
MLKKLQNIQNRLDTISLLGSYITSNDKYIFISSNGYNIYNGMVMVFLKNIENKDNNFKLELHSEIHSPEILNSNFGIKTSATNNMLAVSAISYNIYDGTIYIYELFKDMWVYRYKIYLYTNNIINGFGANIQFNNNELFISTFYNQLYHYKYDYNARMFLMNKTFKLSESREINLNLNVKVISDNMNNIFISNLTNTLTIINADMLIYTYFIQEGLFNCFYGSELFIYESMLFVSCALYYPFYNIPEEIYNKIYIYDLIYTNNVIKNIILREVIDDIHNDPYFGTHLNVNDKHLIISGRNSIYYYNYNNKKFKFKNKYIIPYSMVNYDYKVLLLDDYFIVGNYGFDELKGAVFIGNLLDDNIPSRVNNIPNSVNKSNLLNNAFSIILLIIIGSFISAVLTLFCYFFASLLTQKIDEKKKKKEDEDFSPYKVYSYIGYVETDDADIVYNPQYLYNPQYYYSSYSSPYNPQYYIPQYYNHNNYIEKLKEKDNSSSKEKVVSYKGYLYDNIQQKYKEKIKPALDGIKKNI